MSFNIRYFMQGEKFGENTRMFQTTYIRTMQSVTFINNIGVGNKFLNNKTLITF